MTRTKTDNDRVMMSPLYDWTSTFTNEIFQLFRLHQSGEGQVVSEHADISTTTNNAVNSCSRFLSNAFIDDIRLIRQEKKQISNKKFLMIFFTDIS
jgi:hypothetical protein